MPLRKSEVSVDALQEELAALKKEVAALKKELSKKSAGKAGADPRVSKLIDTLKAESSRFKNCLELAGL